MILDFLIRGHFSFLARFYVSKNNQFISIIFVWFHFQNVLQSTCLIFTQVYTRVAMLVLNKNSFSNKRFMKVLGIICWKYYYDWVVRLYFTRIWDNYHCRILFHLNKEFIVTKITKKSSSTISVKMSITGIHNIWKSVPSIIACRH